MPAKMKAKQDTASSSSDATTTQKQDPVERRRLQNRLSQRNHRRKIRDRIAKLQERVIANELRAAAPLNGWGQQFTPTPSTPTFHTSIHDHDRDINFLKSLLSMTTDSTMSFLPSCNLSPASSWSSDMTVPLSPTFMPGDSPCFPTESNDFPDITSSTIPNSSLRRDIDISPSTYSNMFDTNAFQGLSDTGASFFSDRFNTTANQPLCYAATEATLPHIIQVLSSMSPQSKIIVLVPPDPTSASTAADTFSTPTSNGTDGLDLYSCSQTTDPFNGVCHCHAQNLHGTSGAQTGSKCWMAPGSHQSGYSPRKDFHADFGQ